MNSIFPLSIKKYAVGFAVITFILLLSLLWLNFNKVKVLSHEMHKNNSSLAEKELEQAIKIAVGSAKTITEELANWDETNQQLNNPIYYNYWRSNRAMEASFIENYFIALEIFDNKGQPITKKRHFPLLSNINDSKLGSFITKHDNKLAMYFTAPIIKSTDTGDIEGYLTTELDLNMILDNAQRFKLIIPTSLEIKINNNMLIPANKLISHVQYKIRPNAEFIALENLMVNTILQLTILTAIFVLGFLYVIFVLMGKPLGVLSLHIDALSSGKHEALNSKTPGFFLISEFNKLQLSLNDYIKQIEKLESIANGNIDNSSEIESELEDEVSGLMLSFNNIVLQLKDTIEEKDHVSNLLQEKANELQKVSEIASSANEAKSIFLANMSHEIRTPLTAIIGFAETSLDKDQTTEERFDALHIIVNSGKHLLQLINDILDLSKVEAHKLVIEQLPTSLTQILTEVESLIKTQALEKSLDFNINYIFPLPESIISDPIRIKQILLNLCNNAIKFTQNGHVHLNVSFSMLEQLLVFEIVDTGIGLTEEQIEKIFTPFSQADASTTRKFGGTGLGLSLSKQLTEMLGGRLSVKSKAGIGSKFTATIATGVIHPEDLIIEQKDLAKTNHQSHQSLIHALLSGQVLIADDIVENQKLVSLYLNKMGITTTVVDNGKSAIDQTESGNFDLVIMDIRMPIMDGLEATSTLRKQGVTIPIIALTANAFKEDRDQCMKAGFTDYLLKPINRNQLYQTLSKYLKPNHSGNQTPITSTLIEDSDYTEILEEFVRSLPERLAKITSVLNNEDWKELKFLIHSLKGTSGNLGYNELYDFTKDIEQKIINEDYTSVRSSTDKLISITERIKSGFEFPNSKL